MGAMMILGIVVMVLMMGGKGTGGHHAGSDSPPQIAVHEVSSETSEDVGVQPKSGAGANYAKSSNLVVNNKN
jgi:hypothetical protein